MAEKQPQLQGKESCEGEEARWSSALVLCICVPVTQPVLDALKVLRCSVQTAGGVSYDVGEGLAAVGRGDSLKRGWSLWEVAGM